MLFDSIRTHVAGQDRRRPGSFFGSALQSPVNRVRYEWHVLLDCWQRLQPHADRFATAFFDTLFAHEPGFVQIFGTASLEAQFLRFAHLLTEIVSAADDTDELRRCVEVVVQRFASDDAETDRSRAVRAAIGAMLREVEAADMTPHMRASWHAAYLAVMAILSGSALQGAGSATVTMRQIAVMAELAEDRRSRSMGRLKDGWAIHQYVR